MEKKEGRCTGTVKLYGLVPKKPDEEDKDLYGFIIPDDGGEDIKVKETSIVRYEGSRRLSKNQRVEYEIKFYRDGTDEAINVTGIGGIAVKGGDEIEVEKFTGTVKWYEPDLGFGFISPDGGGPDIKVYRRSLKGLTSLSENQLVKYEVQLYGSGEYEAVEVSQRV